MNRVILFTPNITNFSFTTQNKCMPSLLSPWMSTALRREVESFEMVTNHSQEAIGLPFRLLTRPPLRILKLRVPCAFSTFNGKGCFPHLTSMFLFRIKFVNVNFDIDKLSLSFPHLFSLHDGIAIWRTRYSAL